jgi:tRNA threonylcarbamoyladenosine biosynthesis protein TsaB
VFGALYEHGSERRPPFAAAPDALAAELRAAGETPLAAGDGSVRFRQLLEAAGIRVEPDDSAAHVVSPLQICRLATKVADLPPESVLPEYLRDPDALPRTR